MDTASSYRANLFAWLILLSIAAFGVVSDLLPDDKLFGLSFWFVVLSFFLIKRDVRALEAVLVDSKAPSLWWCLMSPVYLWKRVNLVARNDIEKRNARIAILSASIALPLFVNLVGNPLERYTIACSDLSQSLSAAEVKFEASSQRLAAALMFGDHSKACQIMDTAYRAVSRVYQSSIRCNSPQVSLLSQYKLASLAAGRQEYSC